MYEYKAGQSFACSSLNPLKTEYWFICSNDLHFTVNVLLRSNSLLAWLDIKTGNRRKYQAWICPELPKSELKCQTIPPMHPSSKAEKPLSL